LSKLSLGTAWKKVSEQIRNNNARLEKKNREEAEWLLGEDTRYIINDMRKRKIWPYNK
jgi:hypothetical protein